MSQSLSPSSALCEENAEWIVEDYEDCGSLVPLTDFGTVTVTNAYATTSSGSQIFLRVLQSSILNRMEWFTHPSPRVAVVFRSRTCKGTYVAFKYEKSGIDVFFLELTI